MTRLSAHIGYLYTELPLAGRLAAAAADGFTAVEHPEPWGIPAAEMRARCADLGLAFAQLSSGMGEAGEKGLAALPGREEAFRRDVLRALDYAEEIGCPYLHPMAGLGGEAETYRRNLDWALRAAEGRLRLLVEAITLPGYHMARLDQALALRAGLGPGVTLLFDSYHAAVLGEDAAGWIAAHGESIGHVHIADHPGRHQPGSGVLDFGALRAALSATGYSGAIGFEYVPDGQEHLAFLADWLPPFEQEDPRNV